MVVSKHRPYVIGGRETPKRYTAPGRKFDLLANLGKTCGTESETPHLAFAPALDVKIDAACRRHFMSGLARLKLSVLRTNCTESEHRLCTSPRRQN